jgi:hypothetical protein
MFDGRAAVEHAAHLAQQICASGEAAAVLRLASLLASPSGL